MMSFNHFDSSFAVLFDLDGTIVDSRQGIVSTLHHVIRTLGHEPVLTRDLTWVVGPPLAELMAEVLAPYGEKRVDEAVGIYRERYQAVGRHQTPIFPGMVDLLQKLAASPVRLFTATSKPAFLAKDILQGHDIAGLFDCICGANADDSGGEKPELIEKIMREQNLQANRTIMIGDRRFDIAGAHANHLRALGVLWGYGGEAELTQAGADYLCESPEELTAAVYDQLSATSQHAGTAH